jgi:opacity protein-like surface antigen
MSKKPKASTPTPVKADTASDPNTITTSDEALTPREFASFQQGPVKSKPKPTIIAPRPVEISPTMPLDKAARPKTKRSMPDFVHNIYVRADYGVGMTDKIGGNHFKRTIMHSVGLGYRFNQVLKADVNFQQRRLARKNKHQITFGALNTIQHSSVFLNAYAHLMDDTSYVIPYLTAGVGYAENRVKDFNASGTEGGNTTIISTSRTKSRDIAWNIGAGAAFILTKHVNLEANYKFVDIGKVKIYSTNTVNGSPGVSRSNKRQHIHEISGGLVINF